MKEEKKGGEKEKNKPLHEFGLLPPFGSELRAALMRVSKDKTESVQLHIFVF